MRALVSPKEGPRRHARLGGTWRGEERSGDWRGGGREARRGSGVRMHAHTNTNSLIET